MFPDFSIFSRSEMTSALLHFVSLFPEHFTVTDDCVQWRSQLMAHIGEESALGSIACSADCFALPLAETFAGSVNFFFKRRIQFLQILVCLLNLAEHDVKTMDELSGFIVVHFGTRKEKSLSAETRIIACRRLLIGSVIHAASGRTPEGKCNPNTTSGAQR